MKVILDVDTGVDDALAILYALRRPPLQVVGITTVMGNVPVETATRNTLQVLELAGRTDIPVAMGAAHPLNGTYVRRAGRVHGENGLGDVELPAPGTRPLAQDAAGFIIEQVRRHPGEITLVPTGRLTNVALALLQAPEIAGLVRACVFMGGAASAPGNATAVAEANIHGDPEAARILFRSGMPLTMVGLDVTMQAILTPEALTAIARRGGEVGCRAAEITRFYMDAYRHSHPHLGGCALHDPLAVEVAADPSVVTCQLLYVDVECRGELTRGMTVVERRRREGLPAPNCRVALAVDAPRFLSRFVERLSSYGEV